jgi:c-di-GMP-binding flagellar brake protein YcgR
LSSDDNPFVPGTEVTLDLVDVAGLQTHYVTRIRDMGEETMSLDSPIESGLHVRLDPGQELGIYRLHGPIAYVAEIKVIETQPGRPPRIITTLPVHVLSQPRRRYFRVNVNLPFRASFCSGVIVNASGNGLLLSTDKGSFKEGSIFEVRFRIPTIPQELAVKVRVVRVESVDGKNYAGVVMDRLRLALQDEIIRYLFIRQREQKARDSQE